MKLAVITSRQVRYPTLDSPQYLDQDNCFMSLGSEAELLLIGNILEPRPYAAAQVTFPGHLLKLPLAWNNRYAASLSLLPAVPFLRSRLDHWADMLYTRFCADFLASRSIDAIYSFPYPLDRHVALVAGKLSKPLVIEMWEDYACFNRIIMEHLGLPKTVIVRETRRYYDWLRDVASRADRVIVPSQVFADRLCGLGVAESKIRVIPVCIDPLPASDPQALREKHGVRDDELVVFHVGALSPWHDLRTLVESLQYVQSDLVYIVSGGRDRDLEEHARRHSTAGARAVFTGRIDSSQLGDYLALADICVAPYRFAEPSGFFPGKVIRYMLAGRAIVATDTPEIREMFKNREAGILVPQENPEALAQALDRLAEDSRERLRSGAIAREIAENSYLTRHHTERLLGVLQELV